MLIVECKRSIGRGVGTAQPVRSRARVAVNRRFSLPRRASAAACTECEARHGASSARENLHDPRYCLGPVENAGRPANDLDAIDVVRGEIRQIDCSARLVDRDAIDQYLEIVALAAAQEHRGNRPGGATPDDAHARDLAQGIGNEADASLTKVAAIEASCGSGRYNLSALDLRRSDDDRGQARRVRLLLCMHGRGGQCRKGEHAESGPTVPDDARCATPRRGGTSLETLGARGLDAGSGCHWTTGNEKIANAT